MEEGGRAPAAATVRRRSLGGRGLTVRRTAAEGFGGDKGTRYERARPSYPPEAIDLLRAEFGLGPGARVIDLAAGTGKLTRLLVATGAEVVAVEPTEGMRVVLEAALPQIDVLDGTAELLPLPDAGADIVTVGQAFHWFDPPAALAEIARVLRPGGGLALLWNERDDTVPWVAHMTAIMNESFEASGGPYERDVDYPAAIAASGRFGPTSYRAFHFEHPMTADLLVERALSSSYVAIQPPEVHEDVERRLRALVADLGAAFALPYRTDVYWCTRS